MDREELRKLYNPHRIGMKINYLFIAEAPPDNINRFFYNSQSSEWDSLYIETMDAIYRNYYPHIFWPKNSENNSVLRDTPVLRLLKPYFLQMFQHHGFYLIDALPDTVENLRKIDQLKGKKALIRKHQDKLIKCINDLNKENENIKNCEAYGLKIIIVSAPVHRVIRIKLRNEHYNIVNYNQDLRISFLYKQPQYRQVVGDSVKPYVEHLFNVNPESFKLNK